MNPPATDPAARAGDISHILAGFPNSQDQLLPALHAVQDRIGHVPPESVERIAGHFNLSRAEVHGVVTFYHYFRGAPPARHVVQVCRAEACQSVGGDALLAHVGRALGCGLHEHSADGAFALEPVYCLGQCASGPALTIDGAVHARVTPARFDAVLDKALDKALDEAPPPPPAPLAASARTEAA
ncbi:formate dehydrogenase subunit gamma [Pseudoduganella namucuonensis]|uniref:Formate dehydrogenase gamma subunit n=1 Tax=Pseudoduganella namucuonensis TaxID=1035707 RepID=A0A1I7M6Z7_9BURK|nr:formate dehydrogenase subunit gamma [Pseudoduganella namucuonensis]SFV17715.1 formate dehydrogenase gamma subunit [Pseudoduganella namucuonensis]